MNRVLFTIPEFEVKNHQEQQELGLHNTVPVPSTARSVVEQNIFLQT